MTGTNRFVTIDQLIFEEEKKHPTATGELSSLLYNIALASKVISREVKKAGLVDILGFTGDANVHGEQVKKLDIFAHNTFVNIVQSSGNFAVIASEEDEQIIEINKSDKIGKYVILFDPLDGSSNIDANVSIGTIFSIYRKVDNHEGPGTLEDCLQRGIEQVAAGYVIYGSSTMLVYTTGNGVHGFTLDPSVGEFLLSHPNIKTPSRGNIYSLNEGNYKYWHPGLKNYIKHLQDIDNLNGQPYSARYIGSMVADIHRNLLYGGIFIYPADKLRPKGKLRLLYECNPMAFIVEAAGGKASDGKNRILNLKPTTLHERSPLYIGSKDDVEMVEGFLSESNY